MFGYVLVGFALIPYGLEAVDPLLDSDTDPPLCPGLPGARIHLPIILAISHHDLCTLVSLFVDLGD